MSSLPCGTFTVVSLISAHSEIYSIRFLWYSILVILHGYSDLLHQFHCPPWWNLLMQVALNIITHYPSFFCYFVDSLLVVTTLVYLSFSFTGLVLILSIFNRISASSKTLHYYMYYLSIHLSFNWNTDTNNANIILISVLAI